MNIEKFERIYVLLKDSEFKRMILESCFLKFLQKDVSGIALLYLILKFIE